MKVMVLAGGTGSRLYPLTKITYKHLIHEGTLNFAHLERRWTDAGTFDSPLRTTNLVAETEGVTV